MVGNEVSIRPYAEGDMWVLERTLGDPSQMVHLNGAESPGMLRKRHEKFLALSSDPSAGCMFTITIGSENAPAGSVGYWETEWDGQEGWETGWFVLPEFQGKGIATTATRMLMDHVAKLSRRFLFAYPSVNNGPSNSICRKLGFTLVEETESEYPPKSGRRLRVNVWRLDLEPLRAAAHSVSP
jgi:RimJ/RimL family protein N-acetyltransferase